LALGDSKSTIDALRAFRLENMGELA